LGRGSSFSKSNQYLCVNIFQNTYELIYLLVGIICLAAGYFLGNYIQNLKTGSSQSTQKAHEQHLRDNIAVLDQKLRDTEEHKTHLQTEKEQLTL